MGVSYIDQDTEVNGTMKFFQPPDFKGKTLIRATLQDKANLLPYDWEVARNANTNRPCFGLNGSWYDLALDSASGFQNANYNYFVAPNFTSNIAPYFSTIQAAVNACPSGGACTINIYPGVYPGLSISNKTVFLNALGNVWVHVTSSSPAIISSCPQIYFKGAIYFMNSPSGGFVYPNNTALSSYVLTASNSNLYGEIAWIEGLNLSGSNCDLKINVTRNAINANASCGFLNFDISRLGENSSAPVPVNLSGGLVTIEAKLAYCNAVNQGAKFNMRFYDGSPGLANPFLKSIASSGYSVISGGNIRREGALTNGNTYGASSIIWAAGNGIKTIVSNCRIHAMGTAGSNDNTMPIWIESQSSKLKLQDVQIFQENTSNSVWGHTNAGSGTPIQTAGVIANKAYSSSFSFIGETPITNSNLWV